MEVCLREYAALQSIRIRGPEPIAPTTGLGVLFRFDDIRRPLRLLRLIRVCNSVSHCAALAPKAETPAKHLSSLCTYSNGPEPLF